MIYFKNIVIELIKDRGYKITERPITIDEIIQADKDGTLEEAFGTGTAVGIAMIQEIGYKNSIIHVSNENPVGQMVYEYINGVRTGKVNDELNWMVKVENELV